MLHPPRRKRIINHHIPPEKIGKIFINDKNFSKFSKNSEKLKNKVKKDQKPSTSTFPKTPKSKKPSTPNAQSFHHMKKTETIEMDFQDKMKAIQEKKELKMKLRLMHFTGDSKDFVLLPTTTLDKLMQAYEKSNNSGIGINGNHYLHFFYDGKHIDFNETPASVGMKNGDFVDLFPLEKKEN